MCCNWAVFLTVQIKLLIFVSVYFFSLIKSSVDGSFVGLLFFFDFSVAGARHDVASEYSFCNKWRKLPTSLELLSSPHRTARPRLTWHTSLSMFPIVSTTDGVPKHLRPCSSKWNPQICSAASVTASKYSPLKKHESASCLSTVLRRFMRSFANSRIRSAIRRRACAPNRFSWAASTLPNFCSVACDWVCVVWDDYQRVLLSLWRASSRSLRELLMERHDLVLSSGKSEGPAWTSMTP